MPLYGANKTKIFLPWRSPGPREDETAAPKRHRRDRGPRPTGITAAGTAVAYFTTTGAGNSSPTVVVSAIAKPTITAAMPATGGTVALTRGAVTAPESGTVTYTVSRNGEKADGTCSLTLTPSR